MMESNKLLCINMENLLYIFVCVRLSFGQLILNLVVSSAHIWMFVCITDHLQIDNEPFTVVLKMGAYCVLIDYNSLVLKGILGEC